MQHIFFYHTVLSIVSLKILAFIISDYNNNTAVFYIQLIVLIPYITGFYLKDRKYTTIMLLISAPLFITGYFLSEALAGVLVVGVATASNLLLLICEKIRISNTIIVGIITFLYSGAYLLTGITILSSVLFFGSYIFNVSLVFSGSNRYFIFRAIAIITHLIYVIYGIYVKTYIFSLIDFVTILLIVHSIMYLKNEQVSEDCC